MPPIFQLVYHAGIPGRAEPIRLLLEATRTKYEDSTRSSASDPNSVVAEYVKGDFAGADANLAPFAVPVLVVKDSVDDKEPLVISQTANILLYLATSGHVGPIDLGGKSDTDSSAPVKRLSKGSVVDHRLFAVMLTVSDFIAEVHDTHHPISVGDYYANQKEAALARTAAFRAARVPKFFNNFETNLRKTGTVFLSGSDTEPSYVDLALFHIVDAMDYAFPKLMRKLRSEGEYPKLMTLHETVKAAPVIVDYLKSERRWAFNEHGIFRHYPELDQED